ncbi:acyl-CoA hydrolase [Bradyrhizobium diazoefficiens]
MPEDSSPIDFAGLVRNDDLVVCGQATAEPVTLTEALMAQAAQLPPFRMIIGPVFSETFSASCAGNVSFQSYGVIGNSRRLAKAGRLDVIPSNYSAFCADFAARRYKADVVLVQLAELEGRLSASLSNDYVIDAARGARLVIAEINPDTPFTFGAEWPEDVPIHVRVAARRPPVELASTPLDDVSRRIAAHAAGLINDAVVDLIERGAVTNAEKGIDAGITVTNQVIGTRRLYRFAHENKAVAVRPTSYTHSQNVLARINRLVAINSALQVGLDGSVNSETLNGVAIGAIGGQLDFVRGANASCGGRAIIALPATASDGTSRIVADVETVTTPRADVDAIVTEWGVAELRGCGLAERARRMIAIAAPEHRDALSARLRGPAR